MNECENCKRLEKINKELYKALKEVEPYISYTGHPGLKKIINEALAESKGGGNNGK